MKSRQRRNDRGAISTEYAFMLLAVAVAVTIAVQALGSNVLNLYAQAIAAF